MHKLTLSQQIQALSNKEISSEELTRHYLERIEQYDSQLNSFVSVTPELAIEAAKKADAESDSSALLKGVPLALKDICCMDGTKTSCASKMLDNFIAPYDATVVTKLKQAGVVTLGKTNMDEFY